jgi:hypothetical protein
MIGTHDHPKGVGMTYQHKVKHVGCGLHFIALSWREDWAPNACPECGEKLTASGGGYIHWRQASDEEIFQLVPGETREMVHYGA